MDYLRSAWYVAAFADEIVPGRLLARTLLEQPIVLFRDGRGAVRALADTCPHRFAPLSMGRLHGDAVQCPYHGMRFDGAGRCVHNPHGEGAIPAAARVRRHAVEERHGFVWFWAGDAEHADAALIPDYGFTLRTPADASIRGYLPTRCDYRMLVDNILDLTHADFLHAGSLGNGSLTRSRSHLEDLGDRSCRMAWHASGDVALPAFDRHLARPGAPSDQWTEVTWTAPASMLLRVGATLQGEPPEAGVDTFNLHIATPEGPGTTHYWYWSTRNFAVDPDVNAAIRGMIEHAFAHEDKPMLEAQHRNMRGREFWDLKPVLLPTDAGCVRVRRKLAALIRDEAGQALA